MNAWSKILRAPMPKTTSTKKCAGFSSGNVIRQNVRHRLVLSVTAASETSVEIDCSGAREKTITVRDVVQALRPTIDQSAVPSLENHGVLPPTMWLKSPSELKM